MILAALPAEAETQWFAALVLGFIVVLTVGTLLHVLLREVNRIESNVIDLWETATTVARNTATTWLLAETGEELEEIKKEALRHDELLSRGGGR